MEEWNVSGEDAPVHFQKLRKSWMKGRNIFQNQHILTHSEDGLQMLGSSSQDTFEPTEEASQLEQEGKKDWTVGEL